MGARPIAQMNSLRFGKYDSPRTKWLLKGVVKGIGNMEILLEFQYYQEKFF